MIGQIFISIDEASCLAGVSPETLRQWITEGYLDLPMTMDLFRRTDIEQWLTTVHNRKKLEMSANMRAVDNILSKTDYHGTDWKKEKN